MYGSVSPVLIMLYNELLQATNRDIDEDPSKAEVDLATLNVTASTQ